MKIKEVRGQIIKDSRNDKTIEISIKTKHGIFRASSPSGKSKGKHEKPYYLKKPEHDIIILEKFSDKLAGFNFNFFNDLSKAENLLKGRIGSNSFFALETAILKALAYEKKKTLWQIINPRAKKLPFPVGNCIGGGKHTKLTKGKKPDFQEFLIIPKTQNFADNVFLMKKARKLYRYELKVRKALGKKNDENAWSTCLSNEEVLEIMKKVKEEMQNQAGKEIEIGIDIAASTFFTGVIYNYKNKQKKLTSSRQIQYVLDLIDNYNIDYIEDPLYEEDFAGFGKLRYSAVRARPTSMIVGDDLTVSQISRVKKAVKMRSVNAVILKPNQTGSLLEIAEIVKLCKRAGIKTVMSHRSGETLDNSLADFAFGFQTDYIKTGVIGKEREAKLNRLIDIEKSL